MRLSSRNRGLIIKKGNNGKAPPDSLEHLLQRSLAAIILKARAWRVFEGTKYGRRKTERCSQAWRAVDGWVKMEEDDNSASEKK